MDPIAIQNQIRSLQQGQLSEIRPLPIAGGGEAKDQGQSFGEILGESIQKVNQMQIETDAAMERLATGQGGNVHETLIQMQQAEISMRLLVEVRSKLLNAYQEVMRMQV